MAAAELKRQNKHGILVHLANTQNDVITNKRGKKSAATSHRRAHCSYSICKSNSEYVNTQIIYASSPVLSRGSLYSIVQQPNMAIVEKEGIVHKLLGLAEICWY